MLISGDRLLFRPAGAIDESEEQNTNMLAQTTARGLTEESIRQLAVRPTKGFGGEAWTHIAASAQRRLRRIVAPFSLLSKLIGDRLGKGNRKFRRLRAAATGRARYLAIPHIGERLLLGGCAQQIALWNLGPTPYPQI